MRAIDGKAYSVKEILFGTKYGVDYYQREYKWQTKQVLELVNDLADKFLEDYEPQHERSEVASYGQYFLGSIIVSQKQNQSFVVDGQQRLTTITLLLIFLNNLQRERSNKVGIQDLIFSERFGARSFNLDVPDRTPAMEALFTGQVVDNGGTNESLRNILGRYADIEENFPDELREDALPYFIDWLIEHVILVRITAFSDDDAYTIFETMNDRGLSLAPTDMLKGFLLNNITDERLKLEASRVWKERSDSLLQRGKDEDADAIKTWLRSQYAVSIRERRRGSLPQDFDLIGTEFHRWVRDKKGVLGLGSSADFHRFITADFAFYARQYERIRKAAASLTHGLEEIFYNAQLEFTLQYPLLLAPLRPTDDPPTIDAKLKAVATFIDILLARRVWNWKSTSYSAMQYAVYLAVRDIRGKEVADLRNEMQRRLSEDDVTFASNDRFALHMMNRRTIHHLLARMTDYVERRSGLASRYAEYVAVGGSDRYEVEHIWADHASEHVDEFAHPTEFQEFRNRVGGLLLLPKQFNASYGDLEYENKLPHYFGQNLLAKSLHPQAYERNPGFLRFVESSGLPFRPHVEFKKADLEERQRLYQQLAGEVWNPSRLNL